MSSLQQCLRVLVLVGVLLQETAGAASFSFTPYATPNMSNWLVTANWTGQRMRRASTNQPFSFFMVFGYWPLAAMCGETGHHCKLTSTIQSVDGPHVTVSASLWVRFPTLAMMGETGRVLLGVGDERTFRKIKYGPSNYNLAPRKIVMYRDFRAFKYKLDFTLSTHIEFDPSLELFIQYMTKQNYEEMRTGLTTEVIMPKVQRTSTFCLYALYNAYSVRIRSCIIKTPGYYKSTYMNAQIRKGNYYWAYMRLNTDGIYTINCTGPQYYSPEDLYTNVTITKSINITTIHGPLIRLKGEGRAMTKTFPSWNDSASFLVDVYTTSTLTSFEVDKVDGETHNRQILVKPVSYSLFGILAVYRIEIPWFTDSVSGVYALTVKNKEAKQATQNIEITKAKALQVLTSPKEHTVAQHIKVAFECFVIGNLIDSIRWTRDFEELDTNKYAVKFEEFTGGERQGLRLTFRRPQLADSGIYICQASNRFETKQSPIKLAVYPPGSYFIEPNFQVSGETANSSNRVEGSHVLNVTDEELQEEWSAGEIRILQRGRESKKRGGVKVPWSMVAAGVLAAVVVIVILGGLIYICRVMVRCLRKRKVSKQTAAAVQRHKARSKLSDSEDEEETGTLLQEHAEVKGETAEVKGETAEVIGEGNDFKGDADSLQSKGSFNTDLPEEKKPPKQPKTTNKHGRRTPHQRNESTPTRIKGCATPTRGICETKATPTCETAPARKPGKATSTRLDNKQATPTHKRRPTSEKQDSPRTPRRSTEAGRSPRRSTEAGRSPRRSTEAGRSPRRSTEAGRSPRRSTEVGRSPRRSTEAGQSPRRSTEAGRSQQKHSTPKQNAKRKVHGT